MTGKMMMELHDLSLDLTHDTKYHDKAALILHGAGGTFCSGANFQLAQEIKTPEQGALMSELMTSTLTRFRQCPLISISAIAGWSIGGGAELSTATDFRIMTDSAKLQFVQARMGVSTGKIEAV